MMHDQHARGGQHDKDGTKKRVAEEKMCGRILKCRPTNIYESIQIELEIENGAMDVRSYTQQQKQ